MKHSRSHPTYTPFCSIQAIQASPSLGVKVLGGTGKTHDWTISARIRESVQTPVAGGLTPENVQNAVREVRPFAVDVCSGVRSEGSLDETKLSRFVNRIVSLA